MADCGHGLPYSPARRDTLDSLKDQLQSHQASVSRLIAAIAFLEANPGAQALMNSI